MTNKLTHRFVKTIPESVDEGVLYVSINYSVAVHSCCCGCGKEVVTPIAPTDWKVIFDGDTVSLDPSIGNWAFTCRSHYWIRKNRVQWADQWTDKEVVGGRRYNAEQRKSYFASVDEPRAASKADREPPDSPPKTKPRRKLWEILFRRKS